MLASLNIVRTVRQSLTTFYGIYVAYIFLQLTLFIQEVELCPKISAMGFMDLDKQQLLTVSTK